MQAVGMLVRLLAQAVHEPLQGGELARLPIDQLRRADRARGMLGEEEQQADLLGIPWTGVASIDVERPEREALDAQWHGDRAAKALLSSDPAPRREALVGLDVFEDGRPS